LALGSAEVRSQNQPRPALERVQDRRQRGADASIIGDLARAAERDVEVLAHEHALGFQRNVANRKFRHWSFVSGPWSVVLQKAMPAPPYNFVIPVKGPRPSVVGQFQNYFLSLGLSPTLRVIRGWGLSCLLSFVILNPALANSRISNVAPGDAAKLLSTLRINPSQDGRVNSGSGPWFL